MWAVHDFSCLWWLSEEIIHHLLEDNYFRQHKGSRRMTHWFSAFTLKFLWTNHHVCSRHGSISLMHASLSFSLSLPFIVWYAQPTVETVYCLKFNRINYLLFLTLPSVTTAYKLKRHCGLVGRASSSLAESLKVLLLYAFVTDFWSQVLCGSFGKRTRFLLRKIKGYRNYLSDSWMGGSPGKSF